MKRVRRILNGADAPRSAAAPAAFALLAFAAAAVLLAAPRAQLEPSSPFYRWVNDDVVYIIGTEERAAFDRLKTDEEREHFIEQFWLRRDPTPGTPVNEFKEEHYRRIAYANEHFADSAAGWKTDRGRIYITYGPPDEITVKRDANGAADTQTWLYKYIEGLGRDIVFSFPGGSLVPR